MDRFALTDTDAIAALLGCKPGNGLVNTLNKLQERGTINRGTSTYGEVVRAVLVDMLADFDRIAATRAA